MHFEVPKARTLRQFASEYMMIVISIMTALALEHAAQTIYHHRIALQASQRIDAEVSANVSEIGGVLAHNKIEIVKLSTLRKDLLAKIQGGMSQHDVMDWLTKDFRRTFALSIQSPALRREAWEVAVANQSVSYMPELTLTQYSKIYASMRDVQAVANGAGTAFLDGPKMGDVISNMQMGVSNPEEVFRMLNQIISAYGAVNGNLESLRSELVASSATNIRHARQ